MACQAPRRIFGAAQRKNFGHALANRAGESGVGFGMLVFDDPNAVFVLQNAIIGARTDASVARSRGAGARPGVFADRVVWCCRSERQSSMALRRSFERDKYKNDEYCKEERSISGARVCGLECRLHSPFGRGHGPRIQRKNQETEVLYYRVWPKSTTSTSDGVAKLR